MRDITEKLLRSTCSNCEKTSLLSGNKHCVIHEFPHISHGKLCACYLQEMIKTLCNNMSVNEISLAVRKNSIFWKCVKLTAKTWGIDELTLPDKGSLGT